MTLKPLADRVVLRLVEKENITESGIVLQERMKQHHDKGTVVAVGPDATSAKPGDVVLFDTRAAQRVRVEFINHLVVRDTDLLAVVEA